MIGGAGADGEPRPGTAGFQVRCQWGRHWQRRRGHGDTGRPQSRPAAGGGGGGGGGGGFVPSPTSEALSEAEFRLVKMRASCDARTYARPCASRCDIRQTQ